jgi:hypothetical protein
MATDNLRQGTLQVLARSYLDLNMLDSAETIYRQIEPGEDVHLVYIVQSNLAKIALRRMGATQVEDSVDEAFDQTGQTLNSFNKRHFVINVDIIH